MRRTSMLTDNMQKRPMLEMLSQPFLERIMSEAMEVLSKVGIFVENKEALALLLDAGAQVDRNQRRG
jgi:trimethylamine--corrinoid protein Co-methyltransferase